MKTKNKVSQPFSLFDFLPQKENELKILHERAARLARPIVESIQQQEVDAYICFRLGQEHYGLPFRQAKEVLPHLQLTQVPRVPEFIAGVINHRGSLLAVLDLKSLFHIQPAEYEKDLSILIATGNKMTIGILADRIEGSCHYDPSIVDAALPSEGNIKPEYLSGLHQKGSVALLNIEAIVADILLQVGSILS